MSVLFTQITQIVFDKMGNIDHNVLSRHDSGSGFEPKSLAVMVRVGVFAQLKLALELPSGPRPRRWLRVHSAGHVDSSRGAQIASTPSAGRGTKMPPVASIPPPRRTDLILRPI